MIVLLADVRSVQSYFGSERAIRQTRQAWQIRKLKAWYPEELRAGHMINSQVGESETVYFRLFWQSISQITVFPTFCMWHFPISIPRRQRWLIKSSTLYISMAGVNEPFCSFCLFLCHWSIKTSRRMAETSNNLNFIFILTVFAE